MSLDLKDTLNLPKTDFPMRANLVEREPQRIEHWEVTRAYARANDARRAAGAPLFVMHDGPPFTNGDVHIGTALNKTLKDSILRYKRLKGYVCPYIPGWDSHGLPIEHKVMTELREKGDALNPAEVRRACAEFATKYMGVMREQFRRLGILADWEQEYRTIDPDYEAEELIGLAKIVDQGLIYRSKKPVYWSIPCKTALAEAEIEYREKKSPSIYVRFPVKNPGHVGLEGNVFALIWTTTPWTIPANLAISAGPGIAYAVVRVGSDTYLIARDLVESVAKACAFSDYSVDHDSLPGSSLEGLRCAHPFIERESPVFLADYVTTESGTGLVHTAPGHGLDDYLTGLKHGLEVYCPLDDQACYVNDGQIPQSLVGLSTLEVNGRAPANKGVLEIMEANGSLLGLAPYTHSYPHCWRSKTPVIFRALDQWFISLDKDGQRQRALAALDDVSFVPDWGKNRIAGAVASRPDWCISRQRSWGVPIPAFYDVEGEAYIDGGVIRAVAEKVREHGSQLWFEWSAEDILDGVALPEGWPAASELTLGRDTLDVWIDSASSQNAVLARHPELTRPADLYLEGSDQHRGWFQSSLWIGVLTHGNAPYKQLVTHGFIVNADGTKISKSDNSGKKAKPQTLTAYVADYGADVVRLWICSQDFRNDIPVSDKIISNVGNTYRTLRNTFRFLIGNLYDFDRERDGVAAADLTPLDAWALHKTGELIREVEAAYERYEFQKAYQVIANFVSTNLSATYHDILKDRLYTWAANTHERRSSQTALSLILESLVTILSPMLPFTTDEAWSYYRANQDHVEDSLIGASWPQLGAHFDHVSTAGRVSALLAFKQAYVNDALENLRQAKKIGQSLEARVTVHVGAGSVEAGVLRAFSSESLAEIFIVSSVEVLEDPNNQTVRVDVTPAADTGWVRCPRSWRWVPELVQTDAWGPVSSRCAAALHARGQC